MMWAATRPSSNTLGSISAGHETAAVDGTVFSAHEDGDEPPQRITANQTGLSAALVIASGRFDGWAPATRFDHARAMPIVSLAIWTDSGTEEEVRIRKHCSATFNPVVKPNWGSLHIKVLLA